MIWEFTDKLLRWYDRNRRDLPWRSTSDPYRIWLSEVILQQTRVAQGSPYYMSFVSAFPSVFDLASATEDEVMKLWQGLGYYSRARNLHHTAKVIAEKYEGRFPRTCKELVKLKGIGPYTAAAVSSIAFGEPVPVLDGNVHRVLSRLFGIDKSSDTPAGKRIFYDLAASLIDRKRPGDFNQAMMEFGAVQCVPVNPDCPRCLFSRMCIAQAERKVEELPIKRKKVKQKTRYLYYLIINHRKQTYIRKRTGAGIWRNLYDFPCIEAGKSMGEAALLRTPQFKELLGGKNTKVISFSEEYRHVLTHQRIFARFVELEIKSPLKERGSCFLIYWDDLGNYAVPRLIERYLIREKR